MGLYWGGLIIGSIFASEIWVVIVVAVVVVFFFGRGGGGRLFSERLSFGEGGACYIGILRY